MCVHWDSLSSTDKKKAIMNDSSESGWQRSDNCMDLNSSSFHVSGNPSDSSRALNSNPSFHPPGTIRSSRHNASHDGFTPVRRGRERTLWPHINSYSSVVGSEDGATMGSHGATTLDCNGGSLRQWLDNPGRSVDGLECRDIFSQIVDIVNTAHSQGSVIRYLCPSRCVISSSNHVSFLGSVNCLDLDYLKDRSSSQTAEINGCLLPSDSLSHQHLGSHLDIHDPQLAMKTVKDVSLGNSETSCLQSGSGQDILSLDAARNGLKGDEKHSMESSWYISPEEATGGAISCASNVYQLGVLLFELFCTFVSLEEKSSIMENLRGRVLPPQLLLKWPREASFCLWLLHPEPTSRPKMSELLQSEFLKASRDDKEEESIQEIHDMIEEQELLLEFFLLLQQRKLDAADSLSETISFVSSDIEEVTKLQTDLRVKGDSSIKLDKSSSVASDLMNTSDDVRSSESRKRARLESYSHPDDSSCCQKCHKLESLSGDQGSILSKNSRLMKNFRKLESAYFLTRRRDIKPTHPPLARHSSIMSDGRGSAVVSERSCVGNPSSQEQRNEQKRSGWVNSFLEGLSKYLSFSKLNVKADLKQGDLLNSSNLVCSLSFDRDGEFFASAGVNKKIKVFEYRSILDEDRDIHYPVVEMTSGSKLSSICWNGYIKSQIASSNFDGVVQVWDATRSQIYLEMREHQRRVWSIDFSMADPTMLVSGSDDGSVKLWNINQESSVVTIKTKANVCCVQFPPDSGRSVAFGSADHRIYYYDIRNTKMPLCTLVGHNRTVSYVKFIDSTTLVSASTDNTLKLWDFSMCTSRVLDCPLQSFTGHLNVKNFVGLSVAEGFIATGSESNEVFVYHKAFPMPAFSFKFNSTDSISGDEVDDTSQFISSVCWRGQSSTLVAANSMGHIKLLEMG